MTRQSGPLCPSGDLRHQADALRGYPDFLHPTVARQHLLRDGDQAGPRQTLGEPCAAVDVDLAALGLLERRHVVDHQSVNRLAAAIEEVTASVEELTSMAEQLSRLANREL